MKRILFMMFLLLFIQFTGMSCKTIDENNNREEIGSQPSGYSQKSGKREDAEVNSQCTLIVNGNELVSHKHVRIDRTDRYAELPLIAVMEALGADVGWQNETLVLIKYCGKEYVLDVTNNSLSENGKFGNFIALPPGITHGGCYLFEDDEYIVDSDSLNEFLKVINVKLTIDYAELIIYIDLLQ